MIFYERGFLDPQWIFLSDAFFPESSPYGIINLTGSGGNGMHISLNIPEKGKVQVSPQHPYRTFFSYRFSKLAVNNGTCSVGILMKLMK